MNKSRLYPLEKLRTHAMRYWCLAIVILLFIIIPNTDDVSYYLPALSFVANGHLSVPVGTAGYEYVFYNMPTTAFIEAGFYSLMSFLHIPLNFFTYRIPMALCFMACLALSMPVLKLTNSVVATRQTLFLVLMGVTLFAQCWLLNRPETIGLFFLMLHLYAFYKWTRNAHYAVAAFLSGISLGILPALHPQFSPIAGLVFFVDLYILWKKKCYSNFLYFLLPMCLPLVGVFYYFQKYAPGSFEVLKDQIGSAAEKSDAFRTFFIMFKNAFGLTAEEGLLIRIVSILFYFPTIVMLFYVTYKISKTLFKKGTFTYLELHATALFCGALFILAKSWGSSYTMAVCSFYILFAFIVFLDSAFCTVISQFFTKRFYMSSLLCFGLILAYATIHIIKFSFFDQDYLFPKSSIEHVTHIMQQKNVPLLIMKTQYVPLFTRDIYAEYKTPSDTPNIYWLLPSAGQLVELQRDRIKGKIYLAQVINQNNTVLIMTHNPNIMQNTVVIPLSHSKLRLSAHVASIAYKQGLNYVMLADNIKLF